MVWLTALLSALCFCPISLKIGGQRLGLILTFIEATKGKSGLRANNRTLETLSKLTGKKQIILKVFFFIVSQLIKCIYFHNTNYQSQKNPRATPSQLFSNCNCIEASYYSREEDCQPFVSNAIWALFDKGCWCLGKVSRKKLLFFWILSKL